MTTYDYYKNQTTHELYYNQKMFVETNDKGEKTVMVEVEGGRTPYCIRKGVWNVKEILGATEYIPEGDPNYNPKADKIVWGRFEKGEEQEREILDFSEYDKMMTNF